MKQAKKVNLNKIPKSQTALESKESSQSLMTKRMDVEDSSNLVVLDDNLEQELEGSSQNYELTYEESVIVILELSGEDFRFNNPDLVDKALYIEKAKKLLKQNEE